MSAGLLDDYCLRLQTDPQPSLALVGLMSVKQAQYASTYRKANLALLALGALERDDA